MKKAQGEITVSAIVVFSVFFYRKLTLQTAGSTGHFMLGFFFAYGALSVIALGAPELAGMFALLIMAGDLLANGGEVAKGVSTSLAADRISGPFETAKGAPTAQQVRQAQQLAAGAGQQGPVSALTPSPPQ